MEKFGEHEECLALYRGEHWRTWRNLENMEKFGEHGEIWRGKPTKWAQPFSMPIGPLDWPNIL